MQVYFGRAAADLMKNWKEINVFVAEDAFGDQVPFMYRIEYGSGPTGTDGFTVYDSINRSIPIDIESLPEFILALQEVLHRHEQYEEATAVIQEVESDAFTIITPEQSL